MKAWRKYITIENPEHVLLTDLPFLPGQRVEVLVVAEEPEDHSLLERWRQLFAKTQELHATRGITEEDIAAEIEAYRTER